MAHAKTKHGSRSESEEKRERAADSLREFVADLEAITAPLLRLGGRLGREKKGTLGRMIDRAVFEIARKHVERFLGSLSTKDRQRVQATVEELQHRPGGLGDCCDSFKCHDVSDEEALGLLDDAGFVEPLSVVFDLAGYAGGRPYRKSVPAKYGEVIYKRSGEDSLWGNPVWGALQDCLGIKS
ncbi:MAG: hypothetical protein ACLPJH_06275 [Myxococcaceae bacterium]